MIQKILFLTIIPILLTHASDGKGDVSTTAAECKCPKGHALTTFNTPHFRFNCDACGKRNIPMGYPMLGCRQCDWDRCAQCDDSVSVQELLAKARDWQAYSNSVGVYTTSVYSDLSGDPYDPSATHSVETIGEHSFQPIIAAMTAEERKAAMKEITEAMDARNRDFRPSWLTTAPAHSDSLSPTVAAVESSATPPAAPVSDHDALIARLAAYEMAAGTAAAYDTYKASEGKPISYRSEMRMSSKIQGEAINAGERVQGTVVVADSMYRSGSQTFLKIAGREDRFLPLEHLIKVEEETSAHRTGCAGAPASNSSSRRGMWYDPSSSRDLRLGNWVDRETALRLSVRLEAPEGENADSLGGTPHAWLGVVREEAWDPSTDRIWYQGWVYDAYSGLALANRDGAHEGAHKRRLPATRHDGGEVELTLTNRELRYRIDGEDQGVVFTLPADGGRIALAVFTHDGARLLTNRTQIVYSNGGTSLYRLRPVHPIPGGFTAGQDVWSLVSVEHGTRPLLPGDHGVVQGAAENDPTTMVRVLFDPPAGIWQVPLSQLSPTNPEHNEVHGSPEEHARALEGVVLDDSSGDEEAD